MACVVCYLEGGTVVQGPETSGKNPIEEMGGDFSRSKKLERVNSKLSKDKRADVGLDSASMSWETTFNAIKDALMVSDRRVLSVGL